jgi:hypothetical protein
MFGARRVNVVEMTPKLDVSRRRSKRISHASFVFIENHLISVPSEKIDTVVKGQ